MNASWHDQLAEEAVEAFSENFRSGTGPGSYKEISVNYEPQAYAHLPKSIRQMIQSRAEALAALGEEWAKQPQLRQQKDMPTTRSKLRNIAEMGD